jgi:pimeloyl-ACP methyl ester carboxylesterase
MTSSSLPHRVHKRIDGRSYMQTYHAEGTTHFVLFIHGILGDCEETWRDTPIQLMAERALMDADFGSFGYLTRIFDAATTRPHAQQLIAWMRTHLPRYRQIYVVAHSMGGLITREACALLARSPHADDRRLLGRIRHGFFVAVPIAGSSTAGWLQRIPLIGRLNRKVPLLAQPRVAGQQLHNYYRDSVAQLGPDVRRPRFSLFTGSSDGLVAEPPEWVLSEDDRHEGVIEGTHASIKLDQNANSTLLRRIVQIIESDRDDAPYAAPAIALPAAGGAATTVIVIACSATKSTAAEHEFRGARRNAEGVSARLLEARARVKALIESGRLEGREFNEGNRRYRPQNMALIAGPDFGGIADAPKYLSAYRRYMGRSFQALGSEWERFLALPESARASVYVVSGLYGLCRIDESIQNYDCHLSDVNTRDGRTLRDHWRDTLTDALEAEIRGIEERGLRVVRLLNLLAEDDYNLAIDWARLARAWPVLRQRFEKSQGREALDNVGVWLRQVITQPSSLAALRADVDYEDPRFAREDRCRFVAVEQAGAAAAECEGASVPDRHAQLPELGRRRAQDHQSP